MSVTTFRSSISFFFSVQNPATIVALGSILSCLDVYRNHAAGTVAPLSILPG